MERELASRGDLRVLRWFGHVERMDEHRMARVVLMAEVEGGYRVDRGFSWMDGVKLALGSKGMAGGCSTMCKSKERRALVHTAIFFAWFLCFSDLRTALWWFITWRGVGSHYMMQ